MRWVGLIPFLLLSLLCQIGGEETENEESVITTTQSSVEEHTKLDTNLRTALLKALSELENDEVDGKARSYLIGDEDGEVRQIHASNIAVYSNIDNEKEDPKLKSANGKESLENNIASKDDPLKSNIEENQISEVNLSELIVPSSSNNIVSETNEPKNLHLKLSSFSALNSISDKPSKGFSGEKSVTAKGDAPQKQTETTTVAVITSSTEESEAKVEQVQFFSAPLVAAFTVHQDEQGQPKKVEPIFKNPVNQTNEQQQQQQQQQPLLQSEFNNFDLQKKQQILEQELAKLRKEHEDNLKLQASNFQFSIGGFPGFNSNVNYQTLVQNGFNQGKTQHFKQLEPVFTEPDRSIVTRLATVDPQSLLNQNAVSIFNKFDSNRLISKDVQSNIKNTADISLLPSISFNPIVEARNNIPLVQSFLTLPKAEKELKFKPNQFEGFSSGFSGFSGSQQSQPQNVLSPDLVPPTVNSRFANNFQNVNFNKIEQNQNRFLRQEPSAAIGQTSFSILPSAEPFSPKHEVTLVRNSDLFFRQNKPQSLNQNQNSGFSQNFNSINNNRFLRSNLEGTHTNSQTFNIQPSIQPFENNIFNNPIQNTRVFRSNPESTFASKQNSIPVELIPPRIPYFNSNFGFRN